MNDGLYLPLLAALAFCQHLSQREARDVSGLLLNAVVTSLACLVSLLLGSMMLTLVAVPHSMLLTLLVHTGCPLLLFALLQRYAAPQINWLGLRWYWLLLDTLLLALPLFWPDKADHALRLSLHILLAPLLLGLLLAQFATLTQRLARCNLPARLHGQPALLACALLLALALHSLGVHLS
ncbi:hypothetical protein DLM_0663 [Aquitalea magnusonii]|uniref:Uncharacterized protein n=1 Tax=Aquitalea magnusonii TaxID=332411 RepID=A0A3G9GFK7_9NEIS|nr:hypothetical protein [Aquitalea magnusonii]BBF84316.1 hypothetical protein DLM_0663 [Aquitalea magnusonii]